MEQKRTPDGRKRWHAFCADKGSLYDPIWHSTHALRSFLDSQGIVDFDEAGDDEFGAAAPGAYLTATPAKAPQGQKSKSSTKPKGTKPKGKGPSGRGHRR